MTEQILDVDSELQQYIDELTLPQKKSILEVIKAFSNGNLVNKSVSIQEYNKELEEGEAEYQKGDFISHEAMLNEIKKW